MNTYERLPARRRKQSQLDHFGKNVRLTLEIHQVTGNVADLCAGESSYHVELPSVVIMWNCWLVMWS